MRGIDRGADPPGTINLDIQLTLDADVTSAPIAPIPSTRTISGFVFRNTGDGRQPLANGFVDFEPGWDFLAAWTRTDSSGHYLLCGLPTSEIYLGAWVPTFNGTYVTVNPGADAVVDIDLTPK